MKIFSALLFFLITMAFVACSQISYPNRSPQIIDTAAITSVLLWPTGQRYIPQNESLTVELQGLQRGFTCSAILSADIELNTSNDTTFIGSISKVELPANPSCPIDANGLDTAFRLSPFSSGVSTLIAKTPAGVYTDSASFVTATVYAESLSISKVTGSFVEGRFILRDTLNSLTLISDSLLRCETFQGAVYTTTTDSIKVRFHRLLLDSTKYAALPPCLDVHQDSVNVVLDRFVFPKL